MKKASACFRILSVTVSPEEISNEIGVKPTYVRLKGVLTGLEPSRNYVWEYAVADDEGDDLEEVLLRTFAGLEGAREAIVALRDVERVAWCAVFSDQPETGVLLSHAAIQKLQAFLTELSVHFYVSTFE